MNKAELILPGGDLERTKIAFLYGADAVYVGLNKYSLRKTEVRFDIKEIGEAIDFAHTFGKRLFVTFNIFAHNEILKELENDMKKITKFEPDAFIISDQGIFSLAKRVASSIPIHLSTQANTVNIESVKFWQKQGVKRLVLARELTLDEIREIHKAAPKTELEIFVHGAMCISYSGRCLLSSYMTGRKANLGDCAQPCRWDYKVYLEEKMRPGEYYPVEESEMGTNIMGSKDLRTIRYLPEIIEAGVIGLKVEGRNKSEYYLATTAHAYREALNLTGADNYKEKDKKRLEKELEKLNYRDYTTGFLFGNAKFGETAKSRRPYKSWDYLGIVASPPASSSRAECGDLDPAGSKAEIATSSRRYVETSRNDNLIIVKSKIKTNDTVEILTPDGICSDTVKEITDLSGGKLDEINPGREGQKVILKLEKTYPAKTIIRKRLTK